jgi:hypothetical protein
VTALRRIAALFLLPCAGARPALLRRALLVLGACVDPPAAPCAAADDTDASSPLPPRATPDAAAVAADATPPLDAPAPPPDAAAPLDHRRCGWVGALDETGAAQFTAHADWFDWVHPDWYVMQPDGVSIRALANVDTPVILDAASAHGVRVARLVVGADVMGYDFPTIGTHPGPTAPLGRIDAVGAFAAATGRPERFVLGLPNYGTTPTWFGNLTDCAAACGPGYAVTTDHMTTCRSGTGRPGTRRAAPPPTERSSSTTLRRSSTTLACTGYDPIYRGRHYVENGFRCCADP